MPFDKLSKNILNNSGQRSFTSNGNPSDRIMYPAKVISVEDSTGQNRIQARITSLDENNKEFGGRDRDTPDEKLPFAIPLLPEFFHVRPLVGEMVFIILENPSDNSAPRYWIGPIISSQLKLRYQDYKEAVKIFDITNFNQNRDLKNNLNSSIFIPQESDVALQGRDDADVILRPREVIISAGKFKKGTLEPNIDNPCLIQMKQFEGISIKALNTNVDLLNSFSQVNVRATNINLISPLGKFRNHNESNIENNPDLEAFGQEAKTLHPALFGDEAIKLLDLLIRVTLNHIHQPQNPLVSTAESEELQKYTLDGKLQDLISKHIRIN